MQFPINYIKKVEITMKKYIKPYMDITELEEEDIITNSTGEGAQGQAGAGEGDGEGLGGANGQTAFKPDYDPYENAPVE